MLRVKSSGQGLFGFDHGIQGRCGKVEAVMTGGVMSVNVATELTVGPAPFVTTTRYAPSVPAWTLVSVKEALVAPGMFTPLNCHWYCTAARPTAWAVKVTAPPA